MMNELLKILEELSEEYISDDDKLLLYVNRFLNIYSNDFRHQYSLILKTILNISSNNSEDIIAPLEILQENIEQIRKIFEQIEDEECSQKKNFFKFYDHVILETSRLIYDHIEHEKTIKKIEERTSTPKEAAIKTLDMVKEFNENFDNFIVNFHNDYDKEKTSIQTQISEAKIQINNIKLELDTYFEKAKVDVIALISLFSGVVLAFTGTISFTGKALESLSVANIKIIALAILVCGLVGFNILAIMFHYLRRIVFKNEDINSFNELIITVDFVFVILFVVSLVCL